MKNKNLVLYYRIIPWFALLFILLIHIGLSIGENPGFWTDGYIYLLQADYLSIWGYNKLPVLHQAMEYRSFPPLYPLFLSIFNAGSDNVALASILTSVLLLPFSIFYIKWQTKLGLDKYLALLNAILFLLLPSTILFSTEIWSENLYLLLVMIAIYYFDKSNSIKDKWANISLLSSGLVLVTRSVGLSLLIAILIGFYKRDREKIILSVVIMLIPWAIWFYISQEFNYKSTYMESGTFEKYKELIEVHGGGIEGILGLMFVQLKTLWWGLQLQFGYSVNLSTSILATLVLITSLYTLLIRFLSCATDAIYIILYLGIIFLWNFPDHNTRFVYLLIPFLLTYSQMTIKSFSVNHALYKYFKFILPVFIVVVIIPCLMLMTSRYFINLDDSLNRSKNDRVWLTGDDTKKMIRHMVFKEKLKESTINIRDIVLENECVYSINKEFTMFYSKRVTIPPPSNEVGQLQFIEKLDQCKYIYVVSTKYGNYDALYPIDRVKDDSWILQQTFYPEKYGGSIVSVLLEMDNSSRESRDN